MGNAPSSMVTQPVCENSVDRLRRDRDRFVAFAFAGADILIELDADGVIRFSREQADLARALGRLLAD